MKYTTRPDHPPTLSHQAWLACVLGLLAGCVDLDTSDPELGVVTAAVATPLLVEAEASTGAGVIEPDATASGGQLLALGVVGSTASQTFLTAGAISSGQVRVRGGACAPWIKVIVDGATLLTTSVSQTGWTTIPFAAFGGAGAHTVQFNYRYGTRGCVLRIDQATFVVEDPPPPPLSLVIEAESASGAGFVESDATASGGQLRTFTTAITTATASFSLAGPTTSASVRVRGTQCSSGPPWVKILVDGMDFLTTPVSQTSWTTLPLSGYLAGGSHTIGFQYRSGGAGCALHIDQAIFTTQ